MLKTYTMLLRNDIAEFEKRKQMLLEESATELRLAKQVESDFMKGNALKAKLTRAQARYDQVILRLQELNLARSYAGFSTDVLAHPEPATKHTWPNLPIIGALGCFLGLGLGLVLAVSAEMVDSTFNSVADLERAVGASAIAHVPRFDMDALIDQVSPQSNVEASLVAYHLPRSAESEVYRVARTSLMIANRKGAVQTMMMTSPQPGDGKSTTISNLAISFARTGKRVLLIDADMRRPMISRLFGIDAGVGLADVLAGQSSLDQAVAESEVDGLDIMPNGMPTSVPSELLESQRLGKLLQDAGREYDLILIDAPPLLAVADPAIIAPLVDSAILTVRVNKNGRRPVEHAARILQDIDVQPAAVIVNGIDADSKSNYSYGSYCKDQYGYIGHYHERYAAADTPSQPTRNQVPPRKLDRGRRSARRSMSTASAPLQVDDSTLRTAPVNTAPVNTAPVNTAPVNTAPLHAPDPTGTQSAPTQLARCRNPLTIQD
jgi:capsular exopolysaccharide synthesis family protein